MKIDNGTAVAGSECIPMKTPTEEQLENPEWWDKNVPRDCTKVGVSYINGEIWSVEFIRDGTTAIAAPCNADVRFIERPLGATEYESKSANIGWLLEMCRITGIQVEFRSDNSFVINNPITCTIVKLDSFDEVVELLKAARAYVEVEGKYKRD